MRLTAHEQGAPLPPKSVLGKGCKVRKVKSPFLEGERPGGRPGPTDPEGARLVAELIARHGSKSAAARAAGFNPTTFRTWIYKGVYPAEAMKQVRKVLGGDA
ncbi:hypothetical protein [Litchfieldella xinjiangensis]|uniref:hypothetical protein n=1 Tax=Litchfieldella xinjiangensis TaxID=1166948 RepID=UPI0005BA194A|nr:hypothetical protein [Halomonas xinjiangensis]